jgi:hypothetical protein
MNKTIKTSTKAILFAGLACPDGMTPGTLTDEFDQGTIFTLSRPVEIPGQAAGGNLCTQACVCSYCSQLVSATWTDHQ